MTEGSGPGDVSAPGLAETHISVLFFLGDRVYKLKKPVRFDFVDLRSRAERERICHREVELNRRLAPDVYLGVLDVVDAAGLAVDHLVEMRRMPSGRRLSTLVEHGDDLSECIRLVAHQMAALHEGAETSQEISHAGTWQAVKSNWDDNLHELREFTDLLDEETLDQVADDVQGYMEGRRDLFANRVARGRIRDGHGDLQAADIFCLDDGPRILDCIEFRDDFRHGDVALDVAFLVMDLERLGAPELAKCFLAAYREMSGDDAPATLVHHYAAHRALIRSKVTCLRARQLADGSAPDGARVLLNLCARFLKRGRVRLVLIGGLPGTGKSTLATALSDATGWTVLSSDPTRKDLAGISHAQPATSAFTEGIYSAEMTERTYQRLLERARHLLEMGSCVILDASWTSESHRRAARQMAEDTSSQMIELRCDLQAEQAAQRMRTRQGDVSDADERVAAAMEAVADDWPQAATVSTAQPPEDAVRQAIELAGPC